MKNINRFKSIYNAVGCKGKITFYARLFFISGRLNYDVKKITILKIRSPTKNTELI